MSIQLHPQQLPYIQALVLLCFVGFSILLVCYHTDLLVLRPTLMAYCLYNRGCRLEKGHPRNQDWSLDSPLDSTCTHDHDPGDRSQDPGPILLCPPHWACLFTSVASQQWVRERGVGRDSASQTLRVNGRQRMGSTTRWRHSPGSSEDFEVVLVSRGLGPEGEAGVLLPRSHGVRDDLLFVRV